MFSTADTEDNISLVTTNKETSSSTASDAQESTQGAQAAKQQSKEITLKMLFKEMLICIFLAVTTYGALQSTPKKVSMHPQPQRFFSSESFVTDWYKGQLSDALSHVNKADIAFVMYYAPWDAECQYVRGQFEQAAFILGDRVHFSAINCWNPDSECRNQHRKIPSWPVIMAYTLNSRGVLYKGPKEAHSMVKFLELIMNPLKRVSSADDLVHLLSTCDAVAVGYTPLINTPKYYNIWNGVAIQSKEYDTVGEICFAVVTSAELATDLGVEIIPSVTFMLWNESMEYNDENQEWEESKILHWLFEHFSQPIERIIPMWKKAFTFERYANGSPILMLFTPMNPLYSEIPVYSLLRQIGMEYYNCNDNQWVNKLMKLQHIQRLIYQQNNELKFCQDYKLKQALKQPKGHYEVLSQHNKYPWTNTSTKSQKNGLFGFILKRGLALSKVLSSVGEDSIIPPINFEQECAPKVLAEDNIFYENYEKCHMYDNVVHFERKLVETLETTMLSGLYDPLSPEKLFQDHIRHFCKITKFAHQRGPPVLPAKDNGNVTSIQGLACSKNVTLLMLAVDSVINYHFAESLGIDIMNRKDMTAVVILDSKHESQYILSEEISAKSLRDFIIDFTNKKLKRMLRARVEEAMHTHFFESDKDINVAEDTNTVEIIDLATNTFRKFVRTPSTVSIICVCGGACSALITRAALSAARLLRVCGVQTRVGRLDALRHDLPWQYTAHAYPTIFVFPPDSRESESRVFPQGERVSAGGLVALALQSLAPPQHLQVRLALCHLQKTRQEKKTCLSDLRQHVTTLIVRHLKYWRRFKELYIKDFVFKRLLNFHRLSFELGLLHVSDFYENSVKVNSVVESLSILAKSWNLDNLLLRKNINQFVVKDWL